MKYIFLNGTDKFVNTNPFGQKLVFWGKGKKL